MHILKRNMAVDPFGHAGARARVENVRAPVHYSSATRQTLMRVHIYTEEVETGYGVWDIQQRRRRRRRRHRVVVVPGKVTGRTRWG